MSQKQIKKTTLKKDSDRRKNAPAKAKDPTAWVAKKLRPGKKVIGVDKIEGQLAGAIPNSDGLKVIKASKVKGTTKKMRH